MRTLSLKVLTKNKKLNEVKKRDLMLIEKKKLNYNI